MGATTKRNEMVLMCTSLTYKNSRGDHFLARTMDFDLDFKARIMVMPRNRVVAGDAGEYTTKYGFVGAGRLLGHEMYTDGVNECGVGVATLYFPGNVYYYDDTPADKLGLAPQDFVAWALGNAASVDDLAEKVEQIALINQPTDFIGAVPPLHFIISDTTGKTMLLEPQGGELQLIDDPVGVMTNSPDLAWQLQNLSTYGTLTNQERPLTPLMGHALATQGPGTGALGLPGDFTSPSRFVRTTFLKNYAAPTHNVADSLNLLQHILNSVTIPKGVKLKENGQSDYTEYRGYMSLDERAYYMEPYDNLVLQRVALTDDLLAHLDAPREYPISHQVHIQDLAPDTVTD